MNHTKKFASLILSCALSLSSFANEIPAEMVAAGKVVSKELRDTDCNVDARQCSYIATIEMLSFLEACPAVFKSRFKADVTDKDIETIQGYAKNWNKFKDISVKEQAMAENNEFRKSMTVLLTGYLNSIPSHEVGIECERIPMVNMNDTEAEDVSDMLQRTNNYSTWWKKRKAEKSK